MNAVAELYHQVADAVDDGQDHVTFGWHWPRGTFDRRMSALEIARIILPEMPVLVNLMPNPQARAEFEILMLRLIQWPEQALDEVVPWIRRLEYKEEDEILFLQIGAKELPKQKIIFDYGA